MRELTYLNRDIHTYSTFLNTNEKTKHLFTWMKHRLTHITLMSTFGLTVTKREGGRFQVEKDRD